MLQISYRHPYQNRLGQPAVCHIREYIAGITVIIVCSEVRDNPGTSVTSMADVIATAIWHDVEPPPLTRFRWIEHYSAQGMILSTALQQETFALVTFQHNAATGHLEDPRWLRITQADVEALIGERWIAGEPTG